MPGKVERGLEHLIRGAEELIRDIPVANASGSGAQHMETQFERDLPQQQAQALSAMADPATDGAVEISVSNDEMLAHATFLPPAGNGRPIELDDVRSLIESKGITTGVLWDAIKGCILTCNEERSRVSDAVIARGMKPVDEIPPCLVIDVKLLAQEKKDAEAARVDFREVSPFVLVKKGDVLATLTPKQEGSMGTTVRGAAVAFRKEPVSYPKPGKNTTWQDGMVVALCDGKFESTPANFSVDEMLAVSGDVDFHVGNIDFPGDVVIQGEIKDGFTVKVGKSMLCYGSIGASQVQTGGDLVTRQGIIGRDKAVIRVGGTTEAKFIEGCALDSVKSVFVKTSIMNSSVHTRDRLEMGERGIIIGGAIYAQNGVSAAQIGSERSPRTEIHAGVDFSVEQKLIWIRDKNIALAFKLREIESKMKGTPGSRDALLPLRNKIKAAIHQLNNNARDLVQTLDRNEGAEVSVRGTAFPGTYIEICHVSHFITKPKRWVTFRLDKTSGTITERKWDAPAPQ
jgi:uncharacterized protein (DUF342 family)